MHRRPFRTVLLVLLAALAAAGPAAAADRTVPTAWSIVVETRTAPGGGCEAVAFLQVAAVSGATSYAVDIFDTHPRVNAGSTRTGPPFDGDVTTVAGETVRAPSGTHRWGLSSLGQGGGDCSEAAAGFLAPTRWRVSRAVAVVDGRARVLGTLREADGTPAPGRRVTIAGPTRATATTDAAGAYSATVRPGGYRVAAPAGFCAAGAGTCTNTKAVRVSGPTSVDFARRMVELSGHVVQTTCAESCRRDPLGGVTVSARGSGAPATATTAPDGAWSLAVATGRWTVTPSAPDRGFEPREAAIDARGDVAGIDFATCALQAAGRARAARAQHGSSCDPDAIDWTMPDRLTAHTPGAWTQDEALPRSIEVYPSDWEVDLRLAKGGVAVPCPPGTRWRFAVRAPDGARAVRVPRPGCGGRMQVTRLGTYTVTAVKQERDGGRWVDVEPSTRIVQRVKVRDWLIVGLGDSNGSGEGNPPFFFPRCNRAVASYQYLTAQTIEAADPRSSVTFVHAACSGASVQHLVDHGYQGIRPSLPQMAPQIAQVNHLLRARRFEDVPTRTPDAVLVSIGVNNLEFGAVMQFCAAVGIAQHAAAVAGRFTDDTPCELRRVRGLAPVQDFRVDAYRAAPQGKLVLQRVADGLATLPSLYARLDRALSASVAQGGLGVGGRDVFLASYPDFSRDETGATCNTDPEIYSFGLPKFPASTWSWLGTASDRLNEQVRRGAAAQGWTVVPMSPEFRQHGYCAADPYFQGVLESVVADDAAGPFHPDLRGHYLEFANTRPRVCQRLYGNERCESPAP
jgi:hypothetical protein